MDELVDLLLEASYKEPAPPRFASEWMNNPTTYYDSNRKDMTDTFCNELRRWWCELMITSGLSARERMTLFWHNHFSGESTVCPDPRYVYMQNQLYRRSAFGNFKQLIRNISVDKAMLHYLDGRLNKKGKEVNENYARELQELFTLGVTDNDGVPNYTQEDIAEAARALTGWGWWGEGITGDVYCPLWFGHDPTDKKVYGKTIKGRDYGDKELDDLLNLIFEKESAARYIIRKLYRFFVYTDAPLTPFVPISKEIEDNIIAPLASAFRSSNWNVGHILGILFRSQHFYDAQLQASSIKSPLDLLVGTARALSTSTTSSWLTEFTLEKLHVSSEKLGQWLFVLPGVQGWQFYRSWISGTTLPLRHSFTDALIDGSPISYWEITGSLDGKPDEVNGIAHIEVIPYAKQFPQFMYDPLGLVDEIATHLLAYPPTKRLLSNLRDALLQGIPEYEWSNLSEEQKEDRLKVMLKLLMRSANYQLM